MKVKSTVCVRGQYLHFLCPTHAPDNSENKANSISARKCSVPGCDRMAYNKWYKQEVLDVPDTILRYGDFI